MDVTESWCNRRGSGAMRRTIVASVGLILAVALAGFAATPLEGFRGRHRVLVVSAPSEADQAFRRQNRWLERDGAGLRERDVVVIRMAGSTVDAPHDVNLDAKGVRGATGLDAARFGVALIGKDGLEVFQQSEPVTAQSLFAIIDAMPMRREEIQQRRS